MSNDSKAIKNTEDATRKLLSEMLGGDCTRGIDVDSIVYTPIGWVVIEFCRCVSVSPLQSHPNRYSDNWRKYQMLSQIAKGLCGVLYVVNFDDSRNAARVLRVLNITAPPIPGKEYMVTEDVEIDGHAISTFNDLMKWYRSVNADGVVAGVLPTETVPTKPRPTRVGGMICRRSPFVHVKMPKMLPQPPKQVVPPTAIKAAVSTVRRRNPFQTTNFVRVS